ncbi:YnbE family lipoprotein [Allosphingosinicella sp.]|jgi:hypothetical protein|uniref:YnbE family lipoprotein n=1 Tax=Allosphingosinicella sp. TaxID=2823234 RepID=UPI002F0BD89A
MRPTSESRSRSAASKAARAAGILALAAFGPLLASCVNVRAPERPIEVNLNINIRQEVVVRLQQDVRDLIEREKRDY